MPPTEDEILQSLRPQPSNTALQAVAKKAREARDQEQIIEDLEERLKKHKADLRAIYEVDLPELFDQAQITKLSIPAQGNMPAVDLSLTPYYSATIQASWPDDKRQSAFQALTELGHEDLIKTELTITVPREDRQVVTALITAVKQFISTAQISVKESVNHMTLRAWLKEQYERGNPLPPLETIGASVGRMVKMKERK